MSTHNNIDATDTDFPNTLPKKFWNVAPVYPISAATSSCSIKSTRARSMELSIVNMTIGFSRG